MLAVGLCAAFLVGLAAGVWSPLVGPSGSTLGATAPDGRHGLADVWLVLPALAVVLGGLIVWRSPSHRWLGLATAATAVGVLRATTARAAEPPNGLLELAGRRVVLEGTIASVPTRAGATMRFSLTTTAAATTAAATRTAATTTAGEP